ncbi:molybdenum ABC transporter permease [Ornithobacterium rhinotracheale]|uniref:molybdenum ABC transporter permease n=1 Tax=Ornithobacterium rhinotracheale TaxID=28251 RepID=UPI001FB9C062|nr:molybdenum ABC transporter permease [Ornithobacterium rhinotracheale]UOH77026.1 molybdenum ABC transporter permease [Ornithobacterium rhinotracheale]
MILAISTDSFMLVFGIITFILGIALRYWINRRRFYRRNVAGKETFSSYEKAVIVRILERFGKLIAWAFILLGLLMSIASYRSMNKETDKKEPERIEQKNNQ